MDHEKLRKLLLEVKTGSLSVETAVQTLSTLPFAETGFARVDRHRELRCGFPEVIFCEGKQPAHIGAIAARILETSDRLLATRGDRAAFDAVRAVAPDATYVEAARAICVDRSRQEKTGLVGIVSAGTLDIPVAEEARVTSEIMGSSTKTFYDVGVAGLHRLLSHVEELRKARALVVVAGMEGALASVVGGVVAVPVVAVPTSIGYGASFGGLAALLAMLNSCAAGVSVVNIDNGFGAGYVAALINKASAAPRSDGTARGCAPERNA